MFLYTFFNCLIRYKDGGTTTVAPKDSYLYKASRCPRVCENQVQALQGVCTGRDSKSCGRAVTGPYIIQIQQLPW